MKKQALNDHAEPNPILRLIEKTLSTRTHEAERKPENSALSRHFKEIRAIKARGQ